MACIFNPFSLYAQQGQKWSTGGNNIAAGEFFGTTNKSSILFKTNNLEKMILTHDGKLGIGVFAPEQPFDLLGTAKIRGSLFVQDNLMFEGAGSKISSTTGRILFADTDVLFSNKVGIGMSNPEFNLDVQGDANIRGYLYVQDGVIIGRRISGKMLTSDSIEVAERIMSKELELSKDLKLGGNITIDGPGSKIYSNTGNIDFMNTSFSTTGNITAGSISAGNLNITNTNIQNLTVTESLVTQSIQANQIRSDNLEVNNASFSHLGVMDELRIGSNTLILKSAYNAGNELENRFYTENGHLRIQDGNNGYNTLMNLSSGNVGRRHSRKPIEKLDVNGNANIRGTLYVEDGVIIGRRINSERVSTDTLSTLTLDVSHRITSERMNASIMEASDQIRGREIEIIERIRNNNITVDGQSSSISSTTGQISFDDDNLTTSGEISAGSVMTDQLDVQGNVTATSIETGFIGVDEMEINNLASTEPAIKIQCSEQHKHTYINAGNNGYVGVGTTEPQKKLHVRTYDDGTTAGVPDEGLPQDYESRGSIRIEHQLEGGSNSIWDLEPIAGFNAFNNRFQLENNGISMLTLVDNGKVGIGTNYPEAKLHVNGDVKIENLYDYNSDANAKMIVKGSDGKLGWKDMAGLCDEVVCDDNGKVGIGSGLTLTDTEYENHKLIVDGRILTEGVNIVAVVGADYVFEPDYKLLTLKEIEKFIAQHKHLPDVPSAKQMKEEGIELTNMSILLLRKVEELTLHLIELKKQNEDLQNQINQIRN
jgi:hypothetical protein